MVYQTLGLTGNPGAGKSLVAQWFRERGAQVVSGDEIGYEMLKKDSPVFSELIHTFGREIVSEEGDIDRGTLGKMVFQDPRRLDQLNAIVHPPMLQCIQEKIHAFRQAHDPGPWVLDAALIYEWNIEDWFDYVVLVSADQEIRRHRFEQSRRKKNYFEERESRFIPQSEKEKRAHIVIPNNDSINKLYERIQNLFDG